MSSEATEQIKITLKKSLIGRLKSHKSCVYGLGLKKINQVVIRPKTSSIVGMVKKVQYLLEVEGV